MKVITESVRQGVTTLGPTLTTGCWSSVCGDRGSSEHLRAAGALVIGAVVGTWCNKHSGTRG
jgi:hypothetical protein